MRLQPDERVVPISGYRLACQTPLRIESFWTLYVHVQSGVTVGAHSDLDPQRLATVS